jgi:Domain of unknown function (DUF1707)
MARRAAALVFRALCSGGAVLTGPGDEAAGRPGGRGHLRASHADRERVIGVLKGGFVAGMLAKDEFDRRVGQALASRTHAELAQLTADLPGGLLPVRPARPFCAASGQPLVRPGQVITWATMLYAGAWLSLPSPAAPALLILGGFFYLCVLAIAVAAAFENRQDNRSGSGHPRDVPLSPSAPQSAAGRQPAASGRSSRVGIGRGHAADAAQTRRVRQQLPRCGVRAPGVPSRPGVQTRRGSQIAAARGPLDSQRDVSGSGSAA